MPVVLQSDRLIKLVRLLASDTPGEVFAAAAAIKKICTFHDIADALAAHFGVDNSRPPGARAKTPPPATSAFWWRDMAAALLHADPVLIWGGKEAAFLRNVMRMRSAPSPGQVRWMKDIADRARTKREAARAA